MQNRPVLMIVTFNKNVKDYLCQSIADIIGHLIDVQGYSSEEKQFFDFTPDLVLSTGFYCDDLAKKLFPDVPMISATRVLTGVNLEQVLAIPANTRVIVISNPQGPTQENIDLLRQAGIDHIIYDGYWRGKKIDPSKYTYAITPNMSYVCPYTFKNTINLGQKALSVQTFVQILQFFHLDLHYADVFENHYFRQHIDTCRKVVSALNNSERLRKNQTFTLDEMDEGILSIDERGELLFCNQSARNLFSSQTNILENIELQKIISRVDHEPTTEHFDAFKHVWRTAYIFVSVQNFHLLCRKSIIATDNQRQIFYTFRRVDQIRALDQSVRRTLYNKSYSARYTFNDIMGSGPQSLRARSKAQTFATTDQTVLIIGESGTGKEMLAQAIHNASSRADKPFVGINLASISESLIESELFGYQEGAFTGARKGGKQGLLEIANEGTIFLDEIGDAPLGIQIMLLRVLEERVITRVGGLQPIPINIRVIAATNRPLADMIKTGEFRSDLYYRLNVLSIQTASLKTMQNEIIDFLNRFEQQLFQQTLCFSDDAKRILTQYTWPGNFRELKNVAEYLHYASAGKDSLTTDDLPEYLLQEVGLPVPSEIQTYSELKTIFDKDPLLLEMLRIFHATSPKGVGRCTLSITLASLGTPLSEASIKRHLTLLRQKELIRSGSTRQGSFITEKGIAVLQYFDKVNKQ